MQPPSICDMNSTVICPLGLPEGEGVVSLEGLALSDQESAVTFLVLVQKLLCQLAWLHVTVAVQLAMKPRL